MQKSSIVDVWFGLKYAYGKGVHVYAILLDILIIYELQNKQHLEPLLAAVFDNQLNKVIHFTD